MSRRASIKAPYSKAKLADQRYKRQAAYSRQREINSAMAVAQQIYRPPGGFIRNATAPAVLGERKVIDINNNIFAFSAGPATNLLNGCIAGSQNFNRIGRKIMLKTLQVRGHIQAATDGTATEGLCRMIIFYDKQTNGAAPAHTDVVKSQNISGATASTVFDMFNLDNRDRFVILRDRAYSMSNQSTVATQTVAGTTTDQLIEEYVPINMETIYNAGTAGTVGDITTGGLFVIFLSNNASYQFSGAFRLRFQDM